MNIQILSKAEVEKIAPTLIEDTIIISITEINQPFAKIFNAKGAIKNILRLSFDDEISGNNVIKESQAKQIVEFINKNINCPNLIVHCLAGVSRSAGVAAAISKAINGDDMWVFKNGKFVPNMLVYRKVLNAFKIPIIDEEITRKENINLEEWKKEQGLDV